MLGRSVKQAAREKFEAKKIENFIKTNPQISEEAYQHALEKINSDDKAASRIINYKPSNDLNREEKIKQYKEEYSQACVIFTYYERTKVQR